MRKESLKAIQLGVNKTTAASQQICHAEVGDAVLKHYSDDTPGGQRRKKGMRDLTTERTNTTALNYQMIQKIERDEREALNSTLCFDKGSPFIMDVKLVILRVCVGLVIPPHCRDSSVCHHPVSSQAEGAPGAIACLQRWKLNERSRAQLEQQEDAGEGSDNGHAAEHSDGDGKLGCQLEV